MTIEMGFLLFIIFFCIRSVSPYPISNISVHHPDRDAVFHHCILWGYATFHITSVIIQRQETKKRHRCQKLFINRTFGDKT